jgi:hypothetical protein
MRVTVEVDYEPLAEDALKDDNPCIRDGYEPQLAGVFEYEKREKAFAGGPRCAH